MHPGCKGKSSTNSICIPTLLSSHRLDALMHDVFASEYRVGWARIDLSRSILSAAHEVKLRLGPFLRPESFAAANASRIGVYKRTPKISNCSTSSCVANLPPAFAPNTAWVCGGTLGGEARLHVVALAAKTERSAAWPWPSLSSAVGKVENHQINPIIIRAVKPAIRLSCRMLLSRSDASYLGACFLRLSISSYQHLPNEGA